MAPGGGGLSRAEGEARRRSEGEEGCRRETDVSAAAAAAEEAAQEARRTRTRPRGGSPVPAPPTGRGAPCSRAPGRPLPPTRWSSSWDPTSESGRRSAAGTSANLD